MFPSSESNQAMEKLGEDSAGKFINALIKSVQTLCHGYLDFENGVEIIGHINLSVDRGNSQDYILKEKVCKNAENSTLFISNSFHAEPKPEAEVPGKQSQSENQVSQNIEASDSVETGQVSSAISSISSALTGSRERSRQSSGAKDLNASHSQPNTAKRKASDDEGCEVRPAKVSYHDQVSHVTSESAYPPESSSPIDSKESLQALRVANNVTSQTVIPQAHRLRPENVANVGLSLAGSVLEPVVQGCCDAPIQETVTRGDGPDVTLIKRERVEEEGPACSLGSCGGQQQGDPCQQDPENDQTHSVFSVSLHCNNLSTRSAYVPTTTDLVEERQQRPSSQLHIPTSQPQPRPDDSQPQGSEWGRQGCSASHIHPAFADTCSRPLVYQYMSLPLARSAASGSSFFPHAAQRFRKWNWNTKAMGAHRDSTRFRTWDVVKNLSCEFCYARFASPSGLRSHKNRVHLNNLPYQCSICGKGFTKPDNYEGHMNMHNNVKAFKCPHCSKRYPYRTSLNTHLRMRSCQKSLKEEYVEKG